MSTQLYTQIYTNNLWAYQFNVSISQRLTRSRVFQLVFLHSVSCCFPHTLGFLGVCNILLLLARLLQITFTLQTARPLSKHTVLSLNASFLSSSPLESINFTTVWHENLLEKQLFWWSNVIFLCTNAKHPLVPPSPAWGFDALSYMM